MGSLMAGWSSPKLNSKEGLFARSTSFTKEEIETYKKMQRDAEEAHAKAAAEVATRIKSQEIPIKGASEISHEGSPASLSLLSSSVEDELEKMGSYKDWWTKSNWAFLNDMSMDRLNATTLKYTAQYEVATKAESPKEE